MPIKEVVFFCDTTIAYYLLHGHGLLKQEVGRRRERGRLVISNFVRGEYIRGYIVGLLELYFVIKAEQSVEDGFQVFASESGMRLRRLANAFTSVVGWLRVFDGWDDLAKTCRRLGEHVRKLVFDFDHEFGTRVSDPMRCEFGVVSFRQESYTEDQLLDFYDQCQRILAGPDCSQCEFRRAKQREMDAACIDLHGESPRQRFAAYSGYVKQAEWIQKAIDSSKTEPTCWYCDRLGDTVISLSAPTTAVILTGDKRSFPALGEVFGVKVEIVPSLKELRK